MLEVALKHKKKHLKSLNCTMQEGRCDWEFAHVILTFLNLFYDTMLCIVGSDHVAKNMYTFEAFEIERKID